MVGEWRSPRPDGRRRCSRATPARWGFSRGRAWTRGHGKGAEGVHASGEEEDGARGRKGGAPVEIDPFNNGAAGISRGKREGPARGYHAEE
jgi:hypothetical protein